MSTAHCFLGCSLLLFSCKDDQAVSADHLRPVSLEQPARLYSQQKQTIDLVLLMDTIGKTPGNYQYALISSGADLLSSEVLLLKDSAFVNDKLRSSPHMIVKTLASGESMEEKIKQLCSGNPVSNNGKILDSRLAAE